jgi:hypothetical protein
MTLYPVEVKKTSLPSSKDHKNLGITGKLSVTAGKGAVICLCPDIMPIPKKNALIVPVWEV